MGGAYHRHCRLQHLVTATAALTLLLFASASALSLNQLRSREAGEPEKKLTIRSGSGAAVQQRLRTVGPGSSPPSCRSKCGKCSPCKPVHVPIHPGVSLPLEYYPEAWRCKCGNKLFMP
ncbi:EPIDERMAL PATTERNING FACTOR-like protein 5 [Punica granatum]|uniref:Epidermal patterning factor-like protein n=2 Tax=Punica granatum TaxID=22663 RepID=A0A218XRI8_PUNGR|nr:EPIDERMAL PATTERNING FACTOR-like protein 5 [Punica granatum]OWM87805.1 hypothetical protein CDL15_Pgr019389 [Punica granatum]PKI71882.1 hypothetical protein CRG98_007741 [Punica granatum]